MSKGFTSLERELVRTMRLEGFKASWDSNWKTHIDTGANFNIITEGVKGPAEIYVIANDIFYASGCSAYWLDHRGPAQIKGIVMVETGKAPQELPAMEEFLRAYAAARPQAVTPTVERMTDAKFVQAGGYRGAFKRHHPEVVQEIFDRVKKYLHKHNPASREMTPDEVYTHFERDFGLLKV